MRRPRREPRAQTRSVEITDKEILHYDSHNRRLKIRVQLNGVDYKKTARNVQVADDGLHQEILNVTAERMRRGKEMGDAAKEAADIKSGARDWSSMPEGDEKRRAGQVAIREAAQLAAEAWGLSQSGATRPEAAMKYMEARQIANAIVPHVPGADATEKRNYLGLTAAEWGQAGGIKNFYDELPGPFPALVTWMTDTVTQVKPIESEVSL